MKHIKLFEDTWHKLDEFEVLISDFNFEKVRSGEVEMYTKKANNFYLGIKRYRK